MRDMQQQPAGWYRDPVRPNLHRFWSGDQWSEWAAEELAAGANEAVDPVDVPNPGRRLNWS
jgi:Protein of unknown function (DUF2510)